jgi:hypothetical protein
LGDFLYSNGRHNTLIVANKHRQMPQWGQEVSEKANLLPIMQQFHGFNVFFSEKLTKYCTRAIIRTEFKEKKLLKRRLYSLKKWV